MSRGIGFAPGITLGIASALALLLGAPSALALSYTVPVAVHMDDLGGNVLDILPVFDDTGSTFCLDGDCSGADRLIFDISVTSGAFEEILAAALVVFPQGLGYYDDSETVPSATSAVVGGGGRFDFDTPNLSGASNRLFVSYASLATALSTEFSATPAGGLIFSETGGIIPIPEPSTLTLSALGLVALAAANRRRRA
jgi:hypothetical protein